MKKVILCLLIIFSCHSFASNQIVHCKQQIVGIVKTVDGEDYRDEITRLSSDDNLVVDRGTSFSVISSNGQHFYSPELKLQSNGDLYGQDGVGLIYKKSKGIYMISSNEYNNRRYTEWTTFSKCTD